MSTTDKTSLGDRMKTYESVARNVLPPRTPVILRIDGKAFHTFARGAEKPYDDKLMELMNETAIALCKQIQGAQLAYVQSDEISVLIHGYKRFESTPWFDNQVQKMCSIGASIATAAFNCALMADGGAKYPNFKGPAMFDARVFTVPEDEVANYFLWRQQDWSRNSIQMLARSLYSHKELHAKNTSQLQELSFLKGKNWNDLGTQYKRGRCIVKVRETSEDQSKDGQPVVRTKWIVDNEIPIFSSHREYLTNHLVREQ